MDIASPVAKSVCNSHPEVVVFVVTAESEPIARRAAAQSKLRDDQIRFVRLEDKDDVNLVFQQMVGAVRELAALGIDVAGVEIDYTTGTKSMSAGAVAAALATRCGSLKLVSGRRDPQRAVVMDGTERVQTVAPAAMVAYLDLERVHDLLQALRFEAALDLCRGIKGVLLEEDRRAEPRELERIIQMFDRWDKFDHLGCVEILRGPGFQSPRTAKYRVERRLIGRLERMHAEANDGRATEDLLADLANNAWRRWREGKYDDAVARLYRLVEMLAQWALLQPPFSIKTGDVNLARVPESWRGKLEAKRDRRDGRVKIGLAESYALLLDLGSPLGAAYQENGRLGELLGRRNSSILGHGMTPVGRETCESLFAAALALAEAAVADFQSRRWELEFPWLRDEPDPGSAPEASTAVADR